MTSRNQTGGKLDSFLAEATNPFKHIAPVQQPRIHLIQLSKQTTNPPGIINLSKKRNVPFIEVKKQHSSSFLKAPRSSVVDIMIPLFQLKSNKGGNTDSTQAVQVNKLFPILCCMVYKASEYQLKLEGYTQTLTVSESY